MSGARRLFDPEGSNNTLGHDAVIIPGTSKGVITGAYSIKRSTDVTMNNTYGGQFGAVEIARSDMSNNPLLTVLLYRESFGSSYAEPYLDR